MLPRVQFPHEECFDLLCCLLLNAYDNAKWRGKKSVCVYCLVFFIGRAGPIFLLLFRRNYLFSTLSSMLVCRLACVGKRGLCVVSLHWSGFMLYNSLLSITVKYRSIMVKTPSDTFDDIYLGYNQCVTSPSTSGCVTCYTLQCNLIGV